MKKLLAGIIIATFIFTAGIFFVNTKNNQETIQPVVRQTFITPNPSPTIVAPPVTSRREIIITLTTSGFAPNIITIYPGTRFVFVNKSGSNAIITATDYPPLSLGLFKKESELSLVFDKPGVYTYKNGSNEKQTGTVVVKEK